MVLLSIRKREILTILAEKTIISSHFWPKMYIQPPLIFFKSPLMYDIVHFVKKPKLRLWFCYELEEVRL